MPAVISRWKRRNARRSCRVLWIFATYVPRAAWKPSAPLQKKHKRLWELDRQIRKRFRLFGNLGRARFAQKSNRSEGGLLDFLEAASRPLDVIGTARRG